MQVWVLWFIYDDDEYPDKEVAGVFDSSENAKASIPDHDQLVWIKVSDAVEEAKLNAPYGKGSLSLEWLWLLVRVSLNEFSAPHWYETYERLRKEGR